MNNINKSTRSKKVNIHAGVLWHEKHLSYCIVNKDFQILDSFQTESLNLTDPNFEFLLKVFFDKLEHGISAHRITVLNHKTVSASPVHHHYKHPSALSTEIDDRISQFAKANKIDLKKVKNNLKNPKLRLFTNAIESLEILIKGKYKAWEKHVYATALHATKSKTDRLIRNIYHKIKGTSHRTIVGKAEYKSWLNSIG